MDHSWRRFDAEDRMPLVVGGSIGFIWGFAANLVMGVAHVPNPNWSVAGLLSAILLWPGWGGLYAEVGLNHLGVNDRSSLGLFVFPLIIGPLVGLIVGLVVLLYYRRA